MVVEMVRQILPNWTASKHTVTMRNRRGRFFCYVEITCFLETDASARPVLASESVVFK